MTSPLSKYLTSSQQPWLNRRVAWGCALPVAVLLGGWAYLTIAHAQSDQPYLDQPIGWITRPVLSNNDLSSGQAVLFRPEFNKTNGNGSLFANHINADGEIQPTSPWSKLDAGVVLKSQDHSTQRRIFTLNDTKNTAVPFAWESLSPTQQANLGDATTGPKVLNFLRGDTTNEGSAAGQFRKRETPLGAIVHSSLVRWNYGPAVQRLFVGANDGMLHAFDAVTGKEVFAYVPSMLIPRLARLAQPGYKAQAFVDGPLAIANVSVKVNDQNTPKTLLVGGLGGGGKGLFALDVTASDYQTQDAATETLKWEISSDSVGFSNLGYTYAAPSLVRLENGTAAVVVGNGYGSTSGKASLLLIDALKGSLIKEIVTEDLPAGPNGLSTPTLLDEDGDGKADTAYAGDLRGNLWKFEFGADKTGELLPPKATKLFTTDSAQAITTAPALRRHPIRGQLVIFGTGKALIDADLSDKSIHAVYGIWDAPDPANKTLLEQDYVQVTDGAGNRWRTTTARPINWNDPGSTLPLHKGWKLVLSSAGERLLGESPFIENNRFVFTAMNPTTSGGNGVGPGENWLMQVSVFNGGNVDSPIFDVNGKDGVNSADNVDNKIVNGRFIANGVVSQPVLTDSGGLSQTLYNYNPEITLTITPGETTTTTTTMTDTTSTPPRGVSNGHFDVDIYYRSGQNGGGKKGGGGGGNGSSITMQKHIHEYDDKYNVVGVNFLAPSHVAYKVTNAFDELTQFKVLVVNQYLNPASMLQVGPDAANYVWVQDFQGQASATDASFVNSLPIFKSGTMKNFVWRLPLDAFASKDWWGDGTPARAGLIPTQTGCVNGGYNDTPGQNGEIYNGSLTLQLIDPNTPATELELNYPAGGPKYGWRVKGGSRQYVLAEYTLFWHHPNGACYVHDAKQKKAGKIWVPNPPQDSDTKGNGEDPAAGSSDPTAIKNPGGPVTEVNRVVKETANGKVTVIFYSDGSTKTITETNNTTTTSNPGSLSVTYRDGTKAGSPTAGCNGTAGATCLGPDQVPFPNGRFNWRELRSND